MTKRIPKTASGLRIPFIHVRLDEDLGMRQQIENRLMAFLIELRRQKADLAFAADASKPASLMDGISFLDEEKISRRARRLQQLRKSRSGLAHLNREQKEALSALRNGVALVEPPCEDRADEIAAALHDEFPWLAPATERVWHSLRRCAQSSCPGLRLPPLLLDGPPGIGKSAWARHLAMLIGLPELTIDATNQNASFGVVGVQRGWSTAKSGLLIDYIIRNMIGNPLVIIDEIEKAGEAESSKGKSFDLTAALLPLLEPMTATAWTCPYFEVPFDMSWVCWVMTSNDSRRLPSPLVSRCPPIRLHDLTVDQLMSFSRREAGRRGLSAPAMEAVMGTILGCLAHHQRVDLRAVGRMLDRAEELERRPMLN